MSFPEVRTYHGQPVLARPAWTWEVPVYLFAGGLAGASAGLAWASELAGRDLLARRAWAVALTAGSACPPLLVSDLGRPERFLNMLRVFKVTSPMSVGSWLFAVSGTATGAAGLSRLVPLPRPLDRLAAPMAPLAAVTGMPLATYTAVLIANTAVPVWHEARRELPFLFAAGAAAGAGAAAAAVTPGSAGAPARRLAVGAAVAELGVERLMHRRLGPLAGAYGSGAARRWRRAALGLTGAGAALLGAGGYHPPRSAKPRATRALTLAGAALTLGGALSTRFAVFRAGFASAADPAHTVAPQRERLERRRAPVRSGRR